MFWPFIWICSGLVAGLKFVPQVENPWQPENIPKAPPKGYHLYKGVVYPEITQHAFRILNNSTLNLGDAQTFSVQGMKLVGRVEPHPPMPNGGSKSWHRGVTVYIAD